MDRYHRQTALEEIGAAGQQKLAASRVLVVGAGGLGCPALQYLAGAGVGTIGIIDFDRVDISNLHRQILFTTADQGRSKAQAAATRLRALNPEIDIHAYEEELTAENAPGLFSAYDLVIDGSDNFATKFLINDMAVKLGKPLIYGAIQGFDGQVAVFDARCGPCYRCLHPSPPQGKIQNCAEAGVIGALAGIVGTMQAMEAIKIITGHESFAPLIGKLWMIDARTMAGRSLALPKNPACPVCALPPEEIIPHYTSPVCSAAISVPEISCATLATMTGAALIDVRERHEWDEGYISQAWHCPLSALQENPNMLSLPQQAPCVLYCQHGSRSRTAAKILMEAGFTDIYSLEGGYAAWLSHHKPGPAP